MFAFLVTCAILFAIGLGSALLANYISKYYPDSKFERTIRRLLHGESP